MDYKLPKTLLTLLFLCITTQLSALEAVDLSDVKEKYSLNLSLEVLEDQTKALTINDVHSEKYSHKFVLNKKQSPNFGFTDSAYWVRFKLNNKSRNREWLLEMGFTLLDDAQLFCPQ